MQPACQPDARARPSVFGAARRALASGALTAPAGTHCPPAGRLGFAAARVSTSMAKGGATPASAGSWGRARPIAARKAFEGERPPRAGSRDHSPGSVVEPRRL